MFVMLHDVYMLHDMLYDVYMLYDVFMLLHLPPLGVRVLLSVPGEALPHGAAAGRQAEPLVSWRRAWTVSSGHFCITALGRNNIRHPADDYLAFGNINFTPLQLTSGVGEEGGNQGELLVELN